MAQWQKPNGLLIYFNCIFVHQIYFAVDKLMILYIEEEVDGETLKLLASSDGIDQLRACGFTKIKDQLKLRKLAAEPPQDKGGSLMYDLSLLNQHSNIRKSGKLSMAQVKQLSPADKLLYYLS